MYMYIHHLYNFTIPYQATAPTTNKSHFPRKKLVLIDDIPYLHQWKQREEFQLAVTTHILNSNTPYPCVFTITDDEQTNSVHYLFSQEILDNPKVKFYIKRRYSQ